MIYFKSKQAELFYYQKQVDTYQVLIDSFQKILDTKTVQKFEGKVLNIKFERALREIFTNSEIGIHQNALQITIRYNKAYFNHDSKTTCFYIDDNVKFAKIVISPENRINSKDTIDDIKDTIAKIEKNKVELIREIESFDFLQEEYEEICNKIREFNKNHSYTVRQNYKFDRAY